MRWLTIAVIACVGCNEPADGRLDAGPCDGGACGCEIRITAQIPRTGVGESLLVRGTAVHARGRAIRAIYVGAKRATADSLSFSTWSVTLDAEDLRALVTTEMVDGGEVHTFSAPVLAIDFAGAECRSLLSAEIELAR